MLRKTDRKGVLWLKDLIQSAVSLLICQTGNKLPFITKNSKGQG
ncbi:hypothetical protein [Enterococcus mundtii]|nr:hypothetical protein [Enterococcus mundtii]